MLVSLQSNIFICVVGVFMSLVWPASVPQTFFRQKKAFPDLLIMSILEIVRIVRISVFMDFGTCLKRRAPENHEFGRY